MRTTTLLISDDLDGSPGAETRTFGLDNNNYEIDLAEANSTKLTELLAPYVEAGRPVGNGRRRTPRTSTGRRGPAPMPPGVSAREVRQWWAAHPDGLPTLQQRGAIPATVMQAWQNRDRSTPESAPAPRRTRKAKQAA